MQFLGIWNWSVIFMHISSRTDHSGDHVTREKKRKKKQQCRNFEDPASLHPKTNLTFLFSFLNHHYLLYCPPCWILLWFILFLQPVHLHALNVNILLDLILTLAACFSGSLLISTTILWLLKGWSRYNLLDLLWCTRASLWDFFLTDIVLCRIIQLEILLLCCMLRIWQKMWLLMISIIYLVSYQDF